MALLLVQSPNNELGVSDPHTLPHVIEQPLEG